MPAYSRQHVDRHAAPVRMPTHAPGMKIGLFGGSFNPPHAAHRAASLMAMKRLGLDRVWWLVSPGNPLKDTRALPPLADRVAAAQALAAHPRIDVTGLEAAIGTRYSFDTLQWLRRRFPAVHFVWIMGADNLATFHHWQNWRGIADLVPIAVIDRTGAIGAGPFAGRFWRYRLPEAQARRLAVREPPAWVFLHGLKSPVSSTALRAVGGCNH
jgi:nicotinate-nucleotide adenylyltransferase